MQTDDEPDARIKRPVVIGTDGTKETYTYAVEGRIEFRATIHHIELTIRPGLRHQQPHERRKASRR